MRHEAEGHGGAGSDRSVDGERDAEWLRSVTAGLDGEALASTPHAPGREPGDVAHRRVSELLAGDRPMRIVFQPIVDITAGSIAGAEGLARFPGSDDGPQRWFDDARRVGLGDRLEVAACSTALDQLAELPDGAYLSVNLSPDALDAAVRTGMFTGASSHRVVIELTEHVAVANYDHLVSVRNELGDRGVRFAVDDAGAGYSSLRHILRLRPEFIKLDQALTAGIHLDPARRSLASALTGFAEEIGATVIAEGVEDEAELETALSCGVRFAQGYLLARPGPAPLSITSLPIARPKPRVIVVDDDPVVRSVVRRVLTRSGFHLVVEATDGIEALVAAAVHHADVMLLDLHMPRLAGREAMEGIRRVAPDMPIVVLTASDVDPTAAWPVRPAAVVQKTGHLETLPQTLRRLLDPSQPQPQPPRRVPPTPA